MLSDGWPERDGSIREHRLTYLGGALKPSDIAWLALTGGIIAYEIACPPGELLSEGWDRYVESHPILARAVPVIVALHLINALPGGLDPFVAVGRIYLDWFGASFRRNAFYRRR
ncbi:DUF7427 family protein [Mycolicibacterium sphagni]|uniref:Uncharacterized protein n=1 Tax=Mycolicibacterium sphagni TaxID=1786 RepID=A0A255E121_9MYCO|nr:hypothetical protein CG716_05150 [Mycolicibacterium sphagni]